MKKTPLRKKSRITWPDFSYFFTTSSTYLHYPYFRETDQKIIVLNKLRQATDSLRLQLLEFSISMNHLHILTYAESGSDITKFKTMLHSGISREYRKMFKVDFPEIWHGSRTYWIEDGESLKKVTGYIIGNLLKHKEVGSFQDLMETPFSSFSDCAKKHGIQSATELVMSVIAVKEDSFGDVELDSFK